jgi:hypothetical protein
MRNEGEFIRLFQNQLYRMVVQHGYQEKRSIGYEVSVATVKYLTEE